MPITPNVRVVSVPASHPYVRRVLAHPDIAVLPDPLPDGAPAGQWWPPVVLSPGWIADHGTDADVLHLHFGLESFDADELIAAVDAAHAAGWPVVYTVHDLVNPQLVDQAGHEAQLDALLPRVDHVVTLTPGAAAEIESRWGRSAAVLPHPRLADNPLDRSLGLHNDVPVIGVHLKDLRPNVDGPGTVRLLAAALDLLAERGVRASAEVRLQRHVRDEAAREAVRSLCGARDDIVLLEHDRLDDTALAHALSHLDVCILPYRSGTHSGWLELCWDLGVAVAVPDVGFFAEQHQDPTVASFSRSDGGDSLAATLARLLSASPPSGSDERRRLRESRHRLRLEIEAATAEAHAALYGRLLSGVRK